MKLTLGWLKDHLDTTADLYTIAATLTRIGLEVEHVHDPAEALRGFVVAAVREAGPHPNADRLRVCKVDAGGHLVDVVCGALNARAGMLSVFAPVGTYIPGKKVTLGAGVIRGVASNGMLCSAAELGLSDDHGGIMDLPADAPVGTPYAQWAGADPVIEINLTPNRPDAMGIAGIARDLAAAGLGRVITPNVNPTATDAPTSIEVQLDFVGADAGFAPAFAVRCVTGVENGPSPSWMQTRLRSIGLRPINALVDITNYLTFDRARPLHVFDAAKIRGRLVVRRAREGERLLALDGKTYDLDASMVVIADASGPISIAGIMGGEATGCGETTSDVIIEAALWDPANIAETGRKLGIVSDARYRFERGVDPAFLLPGLDLATQLVVETCGGKPSYLAMAGAIPESDTRIMFPESEVARLTGFDVPANDIKGILETLGFDLARSAGNADTLFVKAPSWRPDIGGKADLVEEIVRIAGVDRVEARPLAPLTETVATAILTPLQQRTRQAKRALAASGLVEAVTWSFVSQREAKMFGDGVAGISLANPIAADLSDMRPSLLPGLVAAARRNALRGATDIGLFEVGQIFRGDGEDDQRIAAAAIRRGTAKRQGGGRHWSSASPSVDIFDVKGDVLALLSTLGVPTGGLQVVSGGSAAFHPGRSATLRFGPKNLIGYFGEIHPRVLAELELAAPTVGFEILLDNLPAQKAKATKTKTRLDLPDLTSLQRDFAFIVDENVEVGAIVKAALGSNREAITDILVFDVYAGQGIPEGKKSVAIAATIQPRDHTLTDTEIDGIAAKIVAEVSAKTGAALRG